MKPGIDEWERLFGAWVKHQAGLPSDVPLWPNPDWSQDVAMVAHALAALKPARDAEHCDFPDCEQHWTMVVGQLVSQCEAYHLALDSMFAQLIVKTQADGARAFFPSASGQPWEAITRGNELIKRVRGYQKTAPPPFNGVDFLQNWMRTPNPMLGDNRPIEMLRMGKGARLALFIEEAYESQSRDTTYRKVESKSELRECRMCGGAGEMWQRFEKSPDIWHAFVCCPTLEDVDGQPCLFHLPESFAFYHPRKVDAARYWNLVMGPRSKK